MSNFLLHITVVLRPILLGLLLFTHISVVLSEYLSLKKNDLIELAEQDDNDTEKEKIEQQGLINQINKSNPFNKSVTTLVSTYIFHTSTHIRKANFKPPQQS